MMSYDDLVTCLRTNLKTIDLSEIQMGPVVLRHLKVDRKMLSKIGLTIVVNVL